MAGNTIKTRIQLRHDTEANWISVGDSFIPLVGEACLTIDGTNKGKIKYGDGTSTWNQLAYSGGQDVVEVDATNVTFDKDMIFTYQFGKYVPGSTGQVTIPSDGKTLEGLFMDAYSEEQNPTTTQPSVNVSSSTAKAYEAGTLVSPAWNATFNKGSYTYGPDTAVTVSNWTISNNWGEETSTSASGTFSQITIPDSANYTITAKASYGDGAIPVTNLGSPYEAGQIKAGTATKTSNAITSFRQIFYGVRTTDSALDSAAIRALTNTNNKASARTITIKATEGAKQLVVAIPQGSGLIIKSATITTSLNADVTSQYVNKGPIQVNGANDYDPVAYNVYVYQPASIDPTEIHSVVIGT